MSFPGQRVADRYVLDRPLGSGRGGSVFAARDTRTGAAVALKWLRAPAASSTAGALALDLERAGLRGLHHPHLVRILDAGTSGEQLFVVTELIPGGSLAAQRLPLPAAWQAAVAEQMLEALAYLHGHGILHGDVKTENILVAAEAPPAFKLADFGLAQRSVAAEAGLARGSPAFMAPEIIRGDLADERSDLYALGVTLYEVVFGELPFATEDVREVLLRHLTETPRRLASPGDVEPRLVALLRRLLAKETAARPAEARAALALWRGEAAALPRFVPERLGVLLGRDRELARLEAALDGPGPEIVAVTGPPGIGKTRLLQELALRRSLCGLPVWWWSPYGLHGGSTAEAPSAPEAAAGVGDAVPGDRMTGDSLTGGAGPGAASVSPRDVAARRAARAYAQLGEGAWLLLVDDADDAPLWFRDALAFLLREVAGGAAGGRLVCVAGREHVVDFARDALEAGGYDAADPLELAPWLPAQVEQAAAALLGAQQLHANLSQALVAASGGVPADVESTCRVLVEKKLLRLTGDGALTLAAAASPADLVAPPSARLEAQLARCNPKQREALCFLAVLRAPATTGMLTALEAGLPAELPGLQRAGLVGRIAAGGAPRFVPAHAGIRRHVLGEMAAAERRLLHDRIAAVLEDWPQLIPEESADLHRARGSDLAAARQAIGRLKQHTPEAAGPELLQEALESLLEGWPADVDRDARQAMELELLDALLRLGAYDEVHARVAAALNRPLGAADAQRWRNRAIAAHLARGEPNLALDMLGDAASGAEAPETALLRARAHSQRSEHREALSICEPLVETLGPKDPEWAAALELAASSHRGLGNLSSAHDLLRTALNWSESRQDWKAVASQVSILGIVEFYQGHMQQAEVLFRRAHELFTQLKDPYGTVRSLNSLAGISGELGRYQEARERWRRALDLSRALGETESATYILENLAHLATMLARYAEALQHIDACVLLSRRRGLRSTIVTGLIERGEVLAVLGADAQCRKELAAILEENRGGLDEAHILLTWSGPAIERGEVESADTWLRRARQILEPIRANDELVRLSLLESQLQAARGKRHQAIDLAKETALRAAELRLLEPRIRSEAFLAELLLDSDPAAAVALARQTIALAGADLLEARLRAERVLGLAARARGDRDAALGHYTVCLRILQDITSDLTPDLLDTYLTSPERQRLLDESDELRGSC